MTRKEMFDRITAIQHYIEYSFDATVKESESGTGLVVRGFMTCPTLKQVLKEFPNHYVAEDGIHLLKD